MNKNACVVILEIHLRRETWLTVMLTVAAVGFAVAVTTAGYISCKSCSEVVEGSQSFSLLLLFSAILVYGCLLVFAVDLDTVPSSDFVCALRLHCVPVAYSILGSDQQYLVFQKCISVMQFALIVDLDTQNVFQYLLGVN